MALASKIKFNWYFSDAGQSYIDRRLKENAMRLVQEAQSKKTKANLEEIELFLNNLVYGENASSSILMQKYNEQIAKAVENELEDVFKNFDLHSAVKGVKIRAKKGVTYDTLQKWVNMSKSNITIIENAIKNKNAQSLIGINQQLIKLTEYAEHFLQEAHETYQIFGGKVQNIYAGSAGLTALNLVKQMMAFNSVIRGGANFNPSQFGEAFEELLGRASYEYANASSDEVAEEMLEQLIKVGNKQTSRGVGTNSVSYTAHFNKLKTKQAAKLNKAGFSIQQGNFSANYSYNPNTDKMGKADIIASFPTGVLEDPIEKLRISAKNWTSTRTIGSTSLDSALSRSIDLKVTEFYKLAMLDTGLDQKSNARIEWRAADGGHKFAKIALATDIVMGLNQKNGYANVLIINDQSRIYVKDISSLVSNFNNINKFLKYKEESVEGAAKGSYSQIKRIQSPGRTESYIALMTSALNKMKISYDLSTDLSKI